MTRSELKIEMAREARKLWRDVVASAVGRVNVDVAIKEATHATAMYRARCEDEIRADGYLYGLEEDPYSYRERDE